jgi:hypothetical protein
MVSEYFAAVARGLRASLAGFSGLIAAHAAAAQIQPGPRVAQNQVVQNPEEVGSLSIQEYRIEGAQPARRKRSTIQETRLTYHQRGSLGPRCFRLNLGRHSLTDDGKS